MRTALLALAIALLVVTGCAEKKHLEAVERAWAAQPPVSAPSQERLGALQAFLVQYPANHEYGNPRAAEAATQITELQLALKAERDAESAAARALAGRAQIRSLVAQHMFSLFAEVDHGFESAFSRLVPHPAPPREVTARHDGARVLTRHRLTAPAPYTRPAAALVEEASRAAGRAVLDDAGRVDLEALDTLLDLAWLEPGDELLGVVARDIYPYFAPWVREQLLILRAIDEAGIEKLKNERAAFLARSGQQDDPRPDLIAFYQFLADDSGPLGVIWPALDEERGSADVGFWMRRETDGSYKSLATFLTRVAKTYDPALNRSLESDRPVSMLAPRPTDMSPPEERTWTPAALTGDRLLSTTPASIVTYPRRGAAWRPDGQLLAIHDPGRIRLIDATSGEARELSVPLSRTRNRPARMSFTASGDLLVTSFDGERKSKTQDAVDAEIVFYDVVSGVIADRYPWPGRTDIWQLAVSPDGTGVAAADFVSAAYFPRGDDAGPASVIRLPGSWAVDIDPTGRFVVTGGIEEITLCALPSGEKIASYNGLRSVSSVSFSPDGHRIVLASRDGDRAHLVRFDERNKALVRDAALGEHITHAAWLDDGSVLLHSWPRRTASVWNLEDRSHDVSIVGDDLLAVDRAYRRVVFDTRTDDVVLYSLAP